MIPGSRLLLIAILISSFHCDSTKINKQPAGSLIASDLHPYGRFDITQEKQLDMVSSGVHFTFSFEGIECRVFYALPNKSAHNYLQYEMDGEYIRRVRIEGNGAGPLVLKAGKAGKHVVTLYKATEAHSGSIFIEKLEGYKIQSVRNPSLPLIEFIGNSITCGAASDTSDQPCGKGEYHDYHNAYYAYGPRVARALKSNFILSSVSGIGIYRTWNMEGPSMPQVFEKLNFQVNSTTMWNFNMYTPRIVSIALGTNDLSNGDGVRKRLPFDSAVFVTEYIKFVRLVKSKYSTAQIALLSSPMVSGKNGRLLEHCLEAVKQQTDTQFPRDKPVALHFFQPMQPHGCSGHPSVQDHDMLARELVPFFKKLL